MELVPGTMVNANVRLIELLGQGGMGSVLEPCAMCVGAMVHARVERLVFGAHEPRSGAVNSVFSLLDTDKHNHDIQVSNGILATECAAVMREFFSHRR